MIFATALLIALALDHWIGEPPLRFHPVVWMGNYLGWAGARIAPLTGSKPTQGQNHKAFCLGVLAWSVGAAAVYVVAWIVQRTCLELLDHGGTVSAIPAALSYCIAAVVLGLALKPLLAWAMLKNEVLAVEAALGQSLAAGRERLSWLVSRDTAALTASEVRESAIESLAENLNDSVVAPILWFALLGLPGAAVYRFANTADAMWGYRGIRNGQNWEWAGKWAARADDVLSWVPARITALLIVVVTPRVTFTNLRAEARRTPSPNSGWPMAAMAIALGICLGKPGTYTLNASGRIPETADTLKTIKKASNVLLVQVFAACVAILFIAFPGIGR